MPTTDSSSVRRFPPLSEPSSPAAVAILKQAADPDASPRRLARLASTDAAFALRVLRLVNSSGFGGSGGISDVVQAAALLGVRGLRNVALSFVVSDLAPRGERGDRLLRQALRRAAGARLLAAALGASNPDEYFSVGLLMEVGLSLDSAGDGSGLAIAELPAAHRLIHERAAGRIPHPALGEHLARGYGLPEPMAEAIACHHQPRPADGAFCQVAWGAERLAALFEGGGPVAHGDVICDLAEVFALAPDKVEAALAALPECVAALGGIFQRDLGPHVSLDELRLQASVQLVELNRQYAETIGALRRVVEGKEALADELRSLNRQLEHQATTDALTGLANRRLMDMTLTRDLAKCTREKQPFGFMLLDIDHFKRINDRFGHQVGDRMLRRVADTLASAARKSDLAARFGGEEFCLLLPSTDGEGLAVAARRLLGAVERSFLVHDGQKMSVTASLGVALREPASQESASALIQRADAALYRAKAAGRNRVQIAEPAQPISPSAAPGGQTVRAAS